MLFGNNAWRAAKQPRPQSPPIMAPQTQFPLNPGMGGPVQGQQPPAYPAPTWPGQTADGAYAQGLAQQYAGSLQNQMVPGTIMPPAPTAGPTGSPSPITAPVAAQVPVQQMPNWRDAFHQAMNTWHQQRQGMDRMDWRAARPDRHDYRGGAY